MAATTFMVFFGSASARRLASTLHVRVLHDFFIVALHGSQDNHKWNRLPTLAVSDAMSNQSTHLETISGLGQGDLRDSYPPMMT